MIREREREREKDITHMMKERVETQKLDGGGNDQEGSNKHKRKNKRKLFLSLGRQFRKDLSQFTQFSLMFFN